MSPYPNASDINTYPGITYRFYSKPVLWPFGYGLSYTSFSYTDMTISPSRNVKPCDTVSVSVTVQNTGKVDSDEVIQCYVKQPNASVPVPQVRLVSFARTHIRAGATATVLMQVMLHG